MKAQDYITRQLKDLHQEFGYLSFEYAICGSTGFHIIEVDPYDESMDDIAYVKVESEIVDKFREMYPMEDLYFSEPCDLNDMSNLITSFKPKENKVTDCNVEYYSFSVNLQGMLSHEKNSQNYHALAA